MYIAPNTTIILLQGVPLDNTYTDTIFFANATAQYNHFYGVDTDRYNRKIFTEQSYQRIGRGRIRLQVSADEVYNYNYLMYRNTNYSNKWFYAFITKAPEYVNNLVCEIEFEIDVMQTWFFDYELEMSFVERETQATDVAGDNILDEPVELGPIKCYESNRSNWFGEWGILITTAVDEDIPDPDGSDSGDSGDSGNEGGSGSGGFGNDDPIDV